DWYVDRRVLLRLPHLDFTHRPGLTGPRRLVQAEAHLEHADPVALSVEIAEIAVRTRDALRRLAGGKAHDLRPPLEHAVGAPVPAAGNQGGGGDAHRCHGQQDRDSKRRQRRTGHDVTYLAAASPFT